MRVEVEISDDEAAELRRCGFDVFQANPGIAHTMAHLVAKALPRHIQVGDIVQWGQCKYPVLATWNKWAWVGDEDAGPYDVLLEHLTVVRPVGALPGKAEQ